MSNPQSPLAHKTNHIICSDNKKNPTYKNICAVLQVESGCPMGDITGMIGKITKKITQTSSDMLKTTKLNLNLAKEEEKLKNLYISIGKKVHEIYNYGGGLGEFFDKSYEEILVIEDKIKEYRQLIDIAKGTATCPGCSKTVSGTSDFCPKCGHKIKDATPGMPESIEAGYDESVPKAEIINSYEPEPIIPNTITGDNNRESLEPHEIQDEPNGITDEASHEKICNTCKYVNNDADKFCVKCGRKM